MIPNLPESSPYAPSPKIDTSLQYNFIPSDIFTRLSLTDVRTHQYELYSTFDDVRDSAIKGIISQLPSASALWDYRNHFFVALPNDPQSNSSNPTLPPWRILPRNQLIITYNHTLVPAQKTPTFLIGIDSDGELLLSNLSLQPLDQVESVLAKVTNFLDLIDWKSEYNILIIVIAVVFLSSLGIPFLVLLPLTAIAMYWQKYDVRRHVRHELRSIRLHEAQYGHSAMASGLESAEWVNSFLETFWLNQKQVITLQVRAQILTQFQALKDTLDLSLLKFDLGQRFIRLTKLRTMAARHSGTLLSLEANLEWDSDFDMTISASKGAIGASLRITEVKLAFRVALTFAFSTRLTNPTYISRIRVQIQDSQPEISFTIKPAHASVDIYEVTGIVSLVRGLLFSVIQHQLCPPNFLEILLDPDSIPITELLLDSLEKSTIHYGNTPRDVKKPHPSHIFYERTPPEQSTLGAIAKAPLGAIQELGENLSHGLYGRWTHGERKARAARKKDRNERTKNAEEFTLYSFHQSSTNCN